MLVANLKRTNFMVNINNVHICGCLTSSDILSFFTVLRLYTQTRLDLQVYAFNLDTTFLL